MAAFITFFSGFGLGTILLPVFSLFFPIQIAVAATAVVHLLNNLTKVVLVGKNANIKVVIKFGVPAIIAAFVGALALRWLADQDPIFTYEIFSRKLDILPVKLSIGTLMIIFAMLDLAPSNNGVSIKSDIVGGILSGFFGGLSGHQGAIRSAFLIRSLSKLEFIATGVIIACLVDVVRITTYGGLLSSEIWQTHTLLLILAILFAAAGSISARFLVKNITMKFIRILVGFMLVVIALGLISGII